MSDVAVVSARGAARWTRGHPWIYRSDVVQRPDSAAGSVMVADQRGKSIGWALWSPTSEISLRLLDRDPQADIGTDWWRDRLTNAAAKRRELTGVTSAYRVVHGEGDACPSLICDRYDRWAVIQILSAGLERHREHIVEAIQDVLRPEGILARNDVPVRDKEGLTREVELLHGSVPQEVEVDEHGTRYVAAPWTGQKTGAFLDQRENRLLIGSRARGRALDCFSYHGSFALHLARNATSVIALDASSEALERARRNLDLNHLQNVELLVADAFEYLKAAERSRERFDTIVLDPPAFAKTKSAVSKAVRGYAEINLRAMRLLNPGGSLFTASCSFHVSKALFLEVLQSAAADSGRRMLLRAIVGQPTDHPEVLTIPETGYIKGALLEAAN